MTARIAELEDKVIGLLVDNLEWTVTCVHATGFFDCMIERQRKRSSRTGDFFFCQSAAKSVPILHPTLTPKPQARYRSRNPLFYQMPAVA